jgi:hypothetical protein
MLRSLVFLQALKKIYIDPLIKVNTVEPCKMSTKMRKISKNPQITKTDISSKSKGSIVEVSKKPLVLKERTGNNNLLGNEAKKLPSKSSEK